MSAERNLFTLPLNLKYGEDLDLDTNFEQKVAFVKEKQELVLKFIDSLSTKILTSGQKMEYKNIVLNAGFAIDLLYYDYDFIDQLGILITLINDNVQLFNSIYQR
jgi:hypothetical protein